MKTERKDKHFIKKPIYPGGNKALKELIKQELKYPKEALEKKIEGVVRVRYTIDKNGKVTKTQVMVHLGHGCDEEAERVVKLFKYNVPKNRKIQVHFHKTINIRFKLPKKPEIKLVYEQKPKPSEESKPLTYSYTISYWYIVALNYLNVIPVLTKAIQEQQAQIENLLQTVNSQQQEIDRLNK